jgi:large subunit ribosomal protein L4
MELKLINEKGEATSTLPAPDDVFGREFNESLVHQLVVAYQANARSGTRKQLGRSEVNKSRKKPWKQKGTGRARAGRASSPLWRGGGKTFPSSPDENFSHKVNRKAYRAGVKVIWSQLAREGRISVVEDLRVEQPKTKLLAQKLKGMGFDDVLVITESRDENLYLSARNLTNVAVMEVGKADPVSLVYFPQVLMTRGALRKLEEVLA